MNDCNGIEKYAKELASKKNIIFIPCQQALCLQEKK